MTHYQRWVTLSYIGLALLAWVLLRQIADVVWDVARLTPVEGLPLSVPELIGLAGGIGLLVLLRRNARVNAFANEAAVELAKVTWAPRKETLVSTGVIAVVVGICSLVLFFIDTVWGTLVKLTY
ncbi:MAG: preprotein translocase subunit SecE [Deltaproteobacteria bacterium]|nr:preprotein translocase subunit SecE [Deltaproteobacteria bacterium]